MKVRLFSDVHLEFCPFWPLEGHQDLVILAGDIGIGAEGILWARKIWTNPDQKILFVPGNHEFYHRGDFQNTMKTLEAACKNEGVLPLIWPGDHHFIDGKLFIGGTFWTDFSYWFDVKAAMRACQSGMNDYHLILDNTDVGMYGEGVGKLRPQTTKDLNGMFVAQMTELYDAHPDKDVVVVTHMTPSVRSTQAKYYSDMLTAAYVNTREKWIEERPRIKAWFHGHCHCSSDYKIGDCHVYANPRGYAKKNITENRNFDPELIIEL